MQAMTKPKQLTESQFHAAIEGLEVGERTRQIAYGVLVQGRPQSEFVESLGLTKGAVSQAVRRVVSSHEARPPKGFERVTVVLPEHQAYIVRRWAEEALRKQGQV